jgi:hypothetical protein
MARHTGRLRAAWRCRDAGVAATQVHGAPGLFRV